MPGIPVRSQIISLAAAGAVLLLFGVVVWWAAGVSRNGAGVGLLVAGTALVLSLGILVRLGRRVYREPLESLLASTRAKAAHHEGLIKVGTLVTGIAHEVRNPLTSMKARCFALEELLPPGSPALAQCEVIEGEINRLDRIVRDVLDFARPREREPRRINIAEFLDRVAALVGSELAGREIAFACRYPSGPLHALLDADQIEQVVFNLVRNAAESCPPEGGRVSLECAPRGGGIRISVSDNGAGIPAAFRDRIFDPFFSKKPGGTGLGLSISRNIVRNHGGDLCFDTEEGKGSAFHLDLATCD